MLKLLKIRYLSFLPLLKQGTYLVKSLICLSSMKNHVDFDTDTSDYQYQYFLERKEPLLTAVSQGYGMKCFQVG